MTHINYLYYYLLCCIVFFNVSAVRLCDDIFCPSKCKFFQKEDSQIVIYKEKIFEITQCDVSEKFVLITIRRRIKIM